MAVTTNAGSRDDSDDTKGKAGQNPAGSNTNSASVETGGASNGADDAAKPVKDAASKAIAR